MAALSPWDCNSPSRSRGAPRGRYGACAPPSGGRAHACPGVR